MKRLVGALVVASLLGAPGAVVSGMGSGPVARAAASAGPTVQVQATFNAYVILTITGTGFRPNSAVSISVQSSLLSLAVSGASYVTDANGTVSFGPDEIVAPCPNGAVKGTATVTDGAGNTATSRWSTVCKPVHGAGGGY